MFVLGRLFQHCLMFASKARAFPSEVRLGALILGELLVSPRNILIRVGNVCQDQTLKLIGPICRLRRKLNVNTALAADDQLFNGHFHYILFIGKRHLDLCVKTFYFCNFPCAVLNCSIQV